MKLVALGVILLVCVALNVINLSFAPQAPGTTEIKVTHMQNSGLIFKTTQIWTTLEGGEAYTVCNNMEMYDQIRDAQTSNKTIVITYHRDILNFGWNGCGSSLVISNAVVQ